jgi:hypothetical protein
VSVAVRDALRALAESLPPGAPVTVTVPREELLELLAAEPGATLGGRYDTDQAARILGVSPKTVAHWCVAGRFAGAAKTGTAKGGKWTIPAAAVHGSTS